MYSSGITGATEAYVVGQRSVESVPTRTRYATMPALTGLRGVAAIWVVLFHLFWPGVDPVTRAGYLGVDIFFILSGFVLTHVYFRKEELLTRPGYLRFLLTRLARIYPLHLVTLIFLLVAIVALPGFAHNFGPGSFNLTAFIANLFLIQNWGPHPLLGWNRPTWSLSAEWFAYLLFPLYVLLLRKLEHCSVSLILATVCLVATPATTMLIGNHDLSGVGVAGMLRMGGEFSAGCFLYHAFASGFRLSHVTGYVLAIATLLALDSSLPIQGLSLVSFAATILLCAQNDNLVSKILSIRAVVYLGEISYSVYLLHWILIEIANWICQTDHLKIRWRLLFACISLAVMAPASFRFIEEPARSWGRRIAVGSVVRAELE
jgi:peptidoglycan/LPS O-acetylase OafA/YrhL